MPMIQSKVEYLFGAPEIEVIAEEPYAKKQCDFLQALSGAIRSDKEAKRYSDIQTFAFWIRKASLMQMRDDYLWGRRCYRMGRGLIFHVAPSNVPINFAYSLVYGLLSGNANVIKVSSRRFVQTVILCRIMQEMVGREEFAWVGRQNAVVLYERDRKDATDELSAMCDVRIIWGGDATITQIRKSPMQPMSTEVTFADRYSFGVISTDAVLKMEEAELSRLAEAFYNDTYLMDQNACSSPHVIFWWGRVNGDRRKAAQKRFWRAVRQAAQKYGLEAGKVSDKYTLLCRMAEKLEHARVHCYENRLYVVDLQAFSDSVTAYRGAYGFFFQYGIKELEELFEYVDDRKIQTCAVCGVDPGELAEGIRAHHIRGIDRIVPFGHTLDLGMIWDGYDIIERLTRCIDGPRASEARFREDRKR